MTEMDYDAEKLSLRKLSKRTLQRGFEALKKFEDPFTNPALADERHDLTYDEAVEALSSSYYTITPYSFGHQRPPVVHDEERLMREVALLESLANTIMDDTATSSSINAPDRQFAGLGL
ncbi:hypothetical protein N7G274_003248 [Stereocaulon virgatum]|uniref:NAD(+) ADP-ribosyltransferase n=1 Tax=Stereocaulon virgatum TaxID=373712 RepID=A0ABR4AGA8_9LECA